MEILLTSYLCIGLCTLFYEQQGLLCFSLIALIVSDFQVLCAAHFTSYRGPLVLGTVMYSSMFLINDLITEIYGLKAAQKNISLTLTGHVILILFAYLTLQYHPLPDLPEYARYLSAHNALKEIFHPQLGIFLASQCAYFISQQIDVFVFSQIRKSLPKVLALRTLVSVFFGIIIDTLIFNFLAWEVFAETPVPWKILWTDYIYANTVIQLIILFLNVPVFYVILWLYRSSPYKIWARLSF